MSSRAPGRGDTIVAISTAPGRSAIAVVRLSGADAERIARRVLHPWPSHARMATRVRIHECDAPERVLDDALATWFAAPNSYTGEHVVELATHGGFHVPASVCAALVRAGARLALAGEFTERAVLAGKLDLVRAEAVADLIDARTSAAHRAAIAQLDGALTHELGDLREAVIGIDALLAYDIDFPDEDGGPLPHARVLDACEALLARLGRLLATVPAAAVGRDGAVVVLAGAPNAGKSSLLNALVGESRVIVSEVPGTTRDAIEVMLDTDPWPLRLVDTAGLRASRDPLERLGIEVSERWLAGAHVVVVCGETTEALDRAAGLVAAHTSAPLVAAWTKRDLVSISYEIPDRPWPIVPVSAVRGDGLPALLAAIGARVAEQVGEVAADTPLLTRARHQVALETAFGELSAFREAWVRRALPAPVAASHVHAAGLALETLIGAVDVDDVLARVFSSFCVGK